MSLKKNFFSCTLILLLILATGASYVRFIVLNDYLVAYEGECDPSANDCYLGCGNEECTEKYYYNIVTRHATEIQQLCGDDITDCEAANSCPLNSQSCYITFCDKESECDEVDNLKL